MRSLFFQLFLMVMFVAGARADELADWRKMKQELDHEKKLLAKEQEESREINKKIEVLQNTMYVLETGKIKRKAQPRLSNIFSQKFDGELSPFGKKYPNVIAEIIEDDGKKALKLTKGNDDSVPICAVEYWLPVPEGKRLRVSYESKYENIERVNPASTSTGAGCTLMLRKDGKTVWGGRKAWGSIEWKEVSFEQDVPFGNKGMLVSLGIMGATGAVYFRNFNVAVIE